MIGSNMVMVTVFGLDRKLLIWTSDPEFIRKAVSCDKHSVNISCWLVHFYQSVNQKWMKDRYFNSVENIDHFSPLMLVIVWTCMLTVVVCKGGLSWFATACICKYPSFVNTTVPVLFLLMIGEYAWTQKKSYGE